MNLGVPIGMLGGDGSFPNFLQIEGGNAGLNGRHPLY